MKSERHILLVAAVFPPEPVVSAMRSFELASELCRGNKVRVVSPRPSRPEGYEFHSNSNNYPFEHLVLDSFVYPKSKIPGRFWESYSFGRAVARYIERNRHDIETIFIASWPLFAQNRIVKCCVKYNIPCVLSIQDVYPETITARLPVFGGLIFKLLSPLDLFSQRNAVRVVTISDKLKQYLVDTRSLPEEAVKVVYNWSNSNVDQPVIGSSKKGKKAGPFTFMFLGSLSPTACVEVIIRAYSEAKLSASRLVIAGSGSEKERLKNLANSLSCNSIEFRNVRPEEAPAALEEADVLVFSLCKGSGYFALPSKLVSYMDSGKPIIASVDTDSDSAWVIQRADCGWISESGSPLALAEDMRKSSSTSREELQRLGKNGIKFSRENFSRERNLEQLVKIVKESRYV